MINKDNDAIKFVKSKFKNVAEFARKCEIDTSNVRKNLLGIEKVNIKRLFIYADVLECDMNEILELLYPEEMKKHKQILNEKKSGK